MQPLNFLLITVDCLRPDHLGCYGYRRPTSPVLDRLAGEGVLFRQAMTNGGWTQPGTIALLTSTYGLMYEGCRQPLSPRRPSLPEALQRRGYATAGFSSNPYIGTPFRYERGFELFEDIEPAAAKPRWSRLRGHARLLRSPLSHWLLGLAGLSALPPKVRSQAETVTARCGRWLAGVDGPFFGWLHYMDPHFPYLVDQNLRTPRQRADAWRQLKALYESAAQDYALHPGQEMLDIVLANYDGAIGHVDAQIGVLLEQLARRGLADNTVVIVTADHGDAFFEHGHWSHIRLYEEVVHVPLIVRLPGGAAGASVDHQVQHLDLAPTLLDLAGAGPEPGMLGRSLRPALEGGALDGPQQAICEMIFKIHFQVAVRTGRYKYIYDEVRPDQAELYDLQADPGELQNLAGQHPQVVAQLRAVVEQHLAAVQETRPEAGQAQAAEAMPEEVLHKLRGLGYFD
jgi:arylsulfatase A-like enzyme